MNEMVAYIIRFLIGTSLPENEFAQIGYSNKADDFAGYKIVIRQSQFFDAGVYGTALSLPVLPLPQWEGVPVLYGEPTVERVENTVVLNVDIVAGAFFLLSRYEETICPDCTDQHGRFIGKKSLAYQAGFLHRPIVDEYGRQFRIMLRQNGFNVSEPAAGFNRIYLTHDVDWLAHYRTLRGVAGAFIRQKEPKRALKSFFGKLEEDPWYTFPWLFEQDRQIDPSKREVIVFVKLHGGRAPEDRTNYDFDSRDFGHFLHLCKQNAVKVGLHASYAAGKNLSRIKDEKTVLEATLQEAVVDNRHHFLRSCQPEHFTALTAAGITDDFTMSYADVAGFRLGTCRSVRWIDPVTMQVTSLRMHPLTIMDGTLSDAKYMHLPEEEAFEVSKQLIDQTKKHHGDLTLLWHNTSVEEGKSYHRTLYARLIDYMCNISVYQQNN
jgi:hypothetical protein